MGMSLNAAVVNRKVPRELSEKQGQNGMKGVYAPDSPIFLLIYTYTYSFTFF